MRAAFYQKNGPAVEVIELGQQPTPEAGAGEVRIKLVASGINPSDVKLRAGLRNDLAYPLVIANSDGAGLVDQVGQGVDAAWLGKRVWLYNGQRQGRAFGIAAEHIALDHQLVCELAAEISFGEGATLGIPCMTAHRAVFWDGPVTGQTVLVTGGAGAVGHYAIQLARWGGARVLTTVSGDAKADHARLAGADVIINYREEDVVARVLEATGSGGVDRIVEVDFGGNLKTSYEIIKNCGVICTYASDGDGTPSLPIYPLMANNVSLKFLVLNAIPLAARQQAQRDITNWIADGGALLSVGARYSLDDIAKAHEHVEGGDKFGTVVLDF